jgi:hypothetical protein
MKLNIKSTLARIAGLPEPVRQRLEVLADSPLADELLRADEQRRLTRRAELAEKLASAPKRHAKVITDAGDAMQVARREHEAALAEAGAAGQRRMLAEQASHGAELALVYETQALERELLEGSDPRIADATFWVGEIAERLRFASKIWPTIAKHAGDERAAIQWKSDLVEVRAARERLAEVAEGLRKMQLEALAEAEVTTRLHAAFEAVGDIVRPYGLNAPRLTDDASQVLQPMRDGFRPVAEEMANG